MKQEIHLHVPRGRLVVVGIVVAGVLVGLLARLVSLQILGSAQYTEAAIANYTREVSEPAARGIIYDRNGYVLARNAASYNVTITPANVPDDQADVQGVYRAVSELTGIPVDKGTLDEAKNYGRCVEGPGITQLVALGESLAPYTPVAIKCNVTSEVARIVQEHAIDWPGVAVETTAIRDYPTGALTANLVGYMGPIPAALEEEYKTRNFVVNRDKVGYAGVELSLQEALAGINGKRVVQVDVAGKEIGNLKAPVPAVPGYNLTLSIDTRLQEAASASLQREIDYWNRWLYGNTGQLRISSGAAIAMNPKTGEILAMVSYPTYENNRMARYIPGYYYEQLSKDPRNPLLNNAIQSEYPPGSVFKLSAANGAMNEGVVSSPYQTVAAPGRLQLCEKFTEAEQCGAGNTRYFYDWIWDTRPDGFGTIDFLHCIAYSSNVCFYKLGGGYAGEIPNGGLNIYRLGEYARALGYGARSGIELPGEAKGLIPDPKWKRITQTENWSTGDTYIASVGQGYVLATPLQVLLSGETMANRGRLMQPTVVRGLTNAQGVPQDVWFSPSDFTVWTRSTSGFSWMNMADGTTAASLPTGSYQISPFSANLKWDVTRDAKIELFNCEGQSCLPTGNKKIIQATALDWVRQGMRLAVTDPTGTLHRVFTTEYPLPVAVAGKTGTAEYCDDVALKANRCIQGSWPTHSWTLAFAPYEDPEIVVMAFEYNGGEGALVAAPVVARIMQAYFELKAIDLGK